MEQTGTSLDIGVITKLFTQIAGLITMGPLGWIAGGVSLLLIAYVAFLYSKFKKKIIKQKNDERRSEDQGSVVINNGDNQGKWDQASSRIDDIINKK